MPKLSIRSPLVIIMTVDALATAPLSCYGCSWNRTPEIDSLAALGTVWDRWTSHDDRPGQLLQTWLSGARDAVANWNQKGETVFLTDDATVVSAAEGVRFGRVIRFQPNRESGEQDELSQTGLGQVIAAACEAVDAKTKCLWIHTNALREHWDAPEDSSDSNEDEGGIDDAEYDESKSEEAEPLVLPQTTQPASFQLSETDDPDLPFAWMNRYGAQVRHLDTLIGIMHDACRHRRVTLVLAGTSGFSLGENGWIGHHVGPLRSTDIRLPLIVTGGSSLRVANLQSASHFGDLVGRLERNADLVVPDEWSADQESFSPAVVTESDRASKVVTTPSWFYIEESEDDLHVNHAKLFLKPDDLCDVNDVSRLRRDVMDHFESLDQLGAD